MIELFNILKEHKSMRLQICCEHLSFFRCDTPNELIDHLESRLDYYTVERFNVELSNKTLDSIDVAVSYISSFDIDLYMSKDEYDFINKKYHRSITKYDKSPVNIEEYRFKFQE
jgi:hypothetical protein